MQNAQSTQQFSKFKSHLKEQFGAAIYDSYFERLSLAEMGEDYVTLAAPTRFSASLISQRYALRMRQVWSEQIAPVRSLNVKGLQELAPSAPQGFAATPAPAPVRPSATPRREKAKTQEARSFDAANGSSFALGMTMERFCSNATNALAYRAVAKLLEGQGGSLVMLYGASGRGKTHLLNAAGQEWLRQHPGDNVLYLTYDALMTDVSEAFISKSVKELRSFLQNTDVLLIDDIQLLRGRKRTQEELDCLIDKLRSAGKRVLVAGSVPPKELAETGISARLAGRLGGGLCVAIERPDLDLRVAIAKQFAEEAAATSGVRMASKHLEFIARRCEDSVRELEGALSLIQVAAEATAEIGDHLSDDRVRQLLSEHLSSKKAVLTGEAILDYTVEVFGLSKEDLKSRTRKQPIVRARHAFCFALRKLTDTPLTAIGAMVDRDHTTVMHSIKTAEILAETDPVFGRRITQIFEEFEQR
jgi:chromosomal replication initiator protein